MSIRYKIPLLLSIVLVGLVLLNMALSWKIILPSFREIEIEKAKTNVGRVTEAYYHELENLSSVVSDWSNWDDTYQFVTDENSEYVESNLTDTTFENLKIDFIIFANSEGKVVFQKGYNFNEGQPITDFGGWSEHLKTGELLTDYDENKSKTGLISAAGGAVVFASHPILNSLAEGPSRGTLIFAKYFGAKEIEKLAQLTRLDINIDPVAQVAEQKDRKALEALIVAKNPVEISEISEKELRGYSLIKDIYNQPALLLGINFSRDIYQQGSKAVGYFLIISAAGGLTVLAIVGLLLGVLVLGRIFNFNAKIAEIAQSKNFSKRIVVNGGDEISSMAANVNSMLESLERASSETEAEHQKAQSYLKVMASMFVALDSSGNVSFANQSAKEILGVATDEEIIGKNWLDNFVPQKIRPEVKKVFNDTIAGEKKSDYYENLVLTKKGEERLIAWHNTILKDGGGNVIGTVSSGNDITQYREQSEKEKEQSEDLKKANELMMGREMRIIELKKEVEELKQRLEQNGRKT
ncbi:MAG: hypothetical protein A2359_01790 [Candidatus Moranbacteria bacterium RIFOXYB1_FULL_43_19]|nr:MAG: hypothetical protein A2359_01790 [Candidatus Moranbacteria bacterium RIFOXYB1_FULL_43_19]OGI33062.1 MAG: hypothetical protein A2420_04565 [Candidatus Moranbacteria bacterium RIFOXYC1_FULL_44_13]